MMRLQTALYVLILGMLLPLAGCATTSLSNGEELMQAGSAAEAVKCYMERLSEDPRSVEARIKLVQALRAAAAQHAERGVELEEAGRLDAALMEYPAGPTKKTPQQRAP